MFKITEFRFPSASRHFKFLGKSGCVYSNKYYWVDFESLQRFVKVHKRGFGMNAFKPIDSFVGYVH